MIRICDQTLRVRLILVSSVQRTFSRCFLAKSNLDFLFLNIICNLHVIKKKKNLCISIYYSIKLSLDCKLTPVILTCQVVFFLNHRNNFVLMHFSCPLWSFRWGSYSSCPKFCHQTVRELVYVNVYVPAYFL